MGRPGKNLPAKKRKPIRNKELLQSYILTTAKYDYSVYEKRILYRIVELAQGALQGIHFYNNCKKIEFDLFDNVHITMPIASFLSDNEEDKNYERIKGALESLQKKTFVYEDDEVWECISIIAWAKVQKRSSYVTFNVHPRVWDCLLDFSKGFCKYELTVAMSFKSQYSMRFYELVSNRKNPLTYSIEQLKEMFCVSGKYKLNADFLRYVIDPAKKELDATSPYTFEYAPLKTGKKITAIKLMPVRQPQHMDVELESRMLNKQVSLRRHLPPEISNYLKDSIRFTDKEIKNNLDLFEAAFNRLPDLMGDLALLRGKSHGKKNQKGYIINALRSKLQDGQ